MSKGRIVVVEDEIIVGKDIQSTLQSFGFEVPEVVTSGEEAIQAAFRLSPDLMLMDIMIKGGMDGVDAAEVIRSQFNIPVVYLTAYSDDETLRRAKLTESYGFIAKPFDERELYVAVEFALYRRQLHDQRLEKIQWLEAVLKSFSEPILVLNTEGKVESLSGSAEALINAKEYEVKGKSVQILSQEKSGSSTPPGALSIELKVRGDTKTQAIKSMTEVKNERGMEMGRIITLSREISSSPPT